MPWGSSAGGGRRVGAGCGAQAPLCGPAPRFASAATGGGAPLQYDGQGSFLSAASASRIITSGHGLFVAYASATVSGNLWVGGTAPVDVELRMEVQGSFQGLGFGSFSASGYLELGALCRFVWNATITSHRGSGCTRNAPG